MGKGAKSKRQAPSLNTKMFNPLNILNFNPKYCYPEFEKVLISGFL
jgi:hypothetical protein